MEDHLLRCTGVNMKRNSNVPRKYGKPLKSCQMRFSGVEEFEHKKAWPKMGEFNVRRRKTLGISPKYSQ